MLRRFAVPRLPKCNSILFLQLLRDTLVNTTSWFLTGVLAQFTLAYRCEI